MPSLQGNYFAPRPDIVYLFLLTLCACTVLAFCAVGGVFLIFFFRRKLHPFGNGKLRNTLHQVWNFDPGRIVAQSIITHDLSHALPPSLPAAELLLLSCQFLSIPSVAFLNTQSTTLSSLLLVIQCPSPDVCVCCRYQSNGAPLQQCVHFPYDSPDHDIAWICVKRLCVQQANQKNHSYDAFFL